jgi:hypothetical protein
MEHSLAYFITVLFACVMLNEFMSLLLFCFEGPYSFQAGYIKARSTKYIFNLRFFE